jgi:hypothetical protein
MSRPSFHYALGIVTLTFSASCATAQPIRLGWAHDPADVERTTPFLSNPKTPKPRVALVTGLDATSIGKGVQVAWTPEPADLTEMLKRSKCIARGVIGKSGSTELVLLYPRDFALNDLGGVAKEIVSATKPKDGRITLVLFKPGDSGPSVKEFREPGDLSAAFVDAVPKEGHACRYLVFEQMVMLFISPAEADKMRKEAVAVFVDKYQTRVKDLRNAADREAVKAATQKLTELTSAFFRDLHKHVLFNDRTQAYEALWAHQLHPALVVDPQDMKLLTQLEQFAPNISGSQDKKNCTVEVFTQPDGGATFRYAKAADAAQNRFKDHPKPTMDTFEVERAHYVFQTFRDDKKTGEKEGVDCTKERQVVIVKEKN